MICINMRLFVFSYGNIGMRGKKDHFPKVISKLANSKRLLHFFVWLSNLKALLCTFMKIEYLYNIHQALWYIFSCETKKHRKICLFSSIALLKCYFWWTKTISILLLLTAFIEFIFLIHL